VRRAIDKAIELDPENINLFFARGYANFTSAYYRLAMVDFLAAIRLDPLNHEFYKFMGASEIYLNDETGAEYDLKFALDLNPDDAGIYYYLGLLANDLKGQPDSSFEYLSKAIELDSLNPVYYYQRAWASYNMYDYETALADLDRAFGLDNRNGDFYTLRALILLNSDPPEGDYCEDFRNAERLGTSYKIDRYIREYCQEEMP
jgi:tetratricopeptide (TPR) repeat protein